MRSGGLSGGIGGGLGGVDNDSHDFGPHKMLCVLFASTWHNASICEMRLIPTLNFCILAGLLWSNVVESGNDCRRPFLGLDRADFSFFVYVSASLLKLYLCFRH